MKPRFKKYLQDIKRFSAGAHPDPSLNLLLDRNERLLPHDDKTMRFLCERIAKSRLNLYPEVDAFRRKLAGWLPIDAEQLYITEGVSGAIKSLIETIAQPGDAVLFPAPTFALYPVYAQMFDLEFQTAGYTKDYQLDMERMRSLIGEETSIVFLPNPNVPIEGTLGVEDIASLASHCAKYGAFLALDEVYFPFGGPTAIDLVNNFNNLFVMRSFSKAFGLAGIRLGYVVSTKENIAYISKMRTGYETNTVSAEIASFFIDNYHLVEAYIRDVKEGLAYLKKEFDKLGLKHNGGNASNFIYVEMGDEALLAKTAEALRAKGIYIRTGWPKPYASGFAVTAGPKALMEKFINNLQEAMSSEVV